MTSIGNEAEGATPILLLKTRSTPNDGYQNQFSATRDDILFAPTFVPVLEHKFLDEGLNIVRELLRKKQIGKEAESKYGGLIFTSQRAVEAFAQLVEEGKGARLYPTFDASCI
jgi:uroporphyrinogen-III synthase